MPLTDRDIEWCQECGGTGIDSVRYRHTPRRQRTCYACGGTGKEIDRLHREAMMDDRLYDRLDKSS